MRDHPADGRSISFFAAGPDETADRCPDCGSEAGFVVPTVTDGPSALDPVVRAFSGSHAASSPERACPDCGTAFLLWDPAAALRVGDPVADAAIIELAGVAAGRGNVTPGPLPAVEVRRADDRRREIDAALGPAGDDPDADLLALIGDPLLADLAIRRAPRRARPADRGTSGVA